eukprot:s5390_g7.t1
MILGGVDACSPRTSISLTWCCSIVPDMWATSVIMAESQIAAGDAAQRPTAAIGITSLPAAPPIRAVSVREWLKSQRQAPGYGPISTSMDTAEERLLPDAENHKDLLLCF